jgi:hypothetical protein
MSDSDYLWQENPKRNPPPNEVMVQVRGVDYSGEWRTTAMRKDYKQPPPGTGKKAAKKAYRKGWRWCYENGDKFPDQAIDAWRLIVGNE